MVISLSSQACLLQLCDQRRVLVGRLTRTLTVNSSQKVLKKTNVTKTSHDIHQTTVSLTRRTLTGICVQHHVPVGLNSGSAVTRFQLREEHPAHTLCLSSLATVATGRYSSKQTPRRHPDASTPSVSSDTVHCAEAHRCEQDLSSNMHVPVWTLSMSQWRHGATFTEYGFWGRH